MKEIKFKLKIPNTDDVWEETDYVEEGEDPQTHFENLIKTFNEEEDRRKKQHPNYKPSYRELISVGESTGKEKTICDFHKINTSTIGRKGTNYDLMRCSICEIIIQRFGLGLGFDYKRECHTELVCKQCNKQFKTEVNLKKHNDRGNHDTQDWYPDGV